MDYHGYTEFDFLKDEFFVKWVVNPDPATSDYWQRWLKNHPEKDDEVSRAIEIIQSLKLKDVHIMNDSTYDKIMDRIILYQQNHHKKNKILSIEKSSFSKWYVAASLALIIVAGIVLFNLKVDDHSGRTAVENETNEMITKLAPAGVKLTIKLPDGTLVKMNSETMVTYPEKFSDSARLVYLEGEAFFEVVNHQSKPFIIKTGLAEVEVLGTSFNMKAFGRDDNVEVALISGSVRLRNKQGGEQILEPYEMGVISRNQQLITRNQFDVKEIVGWKDGILLFKMAPFEEVVKKLESWYGVEFTTKPSLNVAGVYSGEFRHETLEHVLTGIAYSSGFNFEINGKKVYVYD
jgi:transmembrane sensor